MSGGLRKGTGIWGVLCYQRLCVAHAPPRPWGFLYGVHHLWQWAGRFHATSGTHRLVLLLLAIYPWVVSLFSGQHCSGRPELVFQAATLTECCARKANHLIKDWLKISLQMFSHHVCCAVCSFGLRWSFSKFGEQSSHAVLCLKTKVSCQSNSNVSM